jgi:hypothetical protein
MHCINAPMQFLQNALAYFALAIIYTSKMFIKSTPVADVIKLLLSVIYEFL